MAWYWHKHGLPFARLRKVTWPEVVHRYWRATGHRYHASTEICTGSVLALLRSRSLGDTWSQNWICTMPVPCQPSAQYQLSSRGIAPCLHLSWYYAVSKYWHESDFPPGSKAGVTTTRVKLMSFPCRTRFFFYLMVKK